MDVREYNHVDLFSGIGGFSLGFSGLARTTWFVEKDERCIQLLNQRFPQVPVSTDIEGLRGDSLGRVDILTGGFPCQDVSQAGRRAGLAGSQSGLFWEFARLIDETKPEWVVIENVRGLLSSGGRRDMGTVLGALGDLGYGWSYRVLDAQFFGVPQRRQRVFIVGHSGADRERAEQVLLEPEGVRGDPDARREAGQVVAGTLAARTRGGGFPGTDEACSGYLQPVVVRMRAGKEGGGKGALVSERSLTIATANDQTLFQPIAFVPNGAKAGGDAVGYVSPTLRGGGGNTMPHVAQPTYVRSHTRNSMDDADRWVERDQALTLAAQPNIGIPASTLASDGYAVRKLMPVECERLQGFPDGWTEGFPDTTRYRMLGNAVAVPVVRWIAERLTAVSAGLNPRKIL